MGQLVGPTDPATDARWSDPKPRKGFFTDTSICIGSKACEVACEEWNHNLRDGDLELLGSSYDNTGALGASTWRHVAFIEQGRDGIKEARESGRALIDLGMPAVPSPPDTDTRPPDTPEFRWLMSSDVCKHCTHAGCLDVCPTGALFRTEFGTVVVQDDILSRQPNGHPATQVPQPLLSTTPLPHCVARAHASRPHRHHWPRRPPHRQPHPVHPAAPRAPHPHPLAVPQRHY